MAKLELYDVEAELLDYCGRRAVRLVKGQEASNTIAILSGSDFKDGVIETEIAGVPREDAPQDMRGFVGITFHVQPHGSQYECFYLRPTNGRADDQLRRNHSTQYISYPDYPWHRLREETPGVTNPTLIWCRAVGRQSAWLGRACGRSCMSIVRSNLA